MSEDKNKPVNLDEQYKAMIEDNENNAPVEAEEPADLGKVDMNKFKPQEAKEADFHLGYHSVSHAELPSGGMFYNEKSEISIDQGYVYNDITFSLPKELINFEPYVTINDINSINPIQPKSKQIDAQKLVYKFRTRVSVDNLKELHIITKSGSIKIPIPKS